MSDALVVTEELDKEESEELSAELVEDCALLVELELTPGKLPEFDLEEPPPQADSASTITETSALWRQWTRD